MSLTVRDYMHFDPISVGPEQSMREVIEIFQINRFRHLPVLDNGVLIGIITDRDIKRFSPSLLRQTEQEEYEQILNTTPVKRIMTRDPLSVGPDTPLQEVADIIREKKVGGIPVLENNQLVGMITESDLMRVLCDLLQKD